MIATRNDTLRLDAPVVRGINATEDRTADLMRVIRHALKAGSATSPLDRAIRSAAGVAGPAALASDDADCRARHLARRMNTLLVRRTIDPHRETVRGN
jgi:hypothetical protein